VAASKARAKAGTDEIRRAIGGLQDFAATKRKGLPARKSLSGRR
jgi:hypothetical protein